MFNVYSGFACQPAKGFIYQVARLASGTSFGPETIYNFWHAGFLPMLFGPEDTHRPYSHTHTYIPAAKETQRKVQTGHKGTGNDYDWDDFVAIALQVTAWACNVAWLAWPG